MPGPMSAPNGSVFLTLHPRGGNRNIKTGKTAVKKGKIERQEVIDSARRLQKARRAQQREEEKD